MILDALVVTQEFQRAARRLTRGRGENLRAGRRGQTRKRQRQCRANEITIEFVLQEIQEVDETGDDLLSQRRVGR